MSFYLYTLSVCLIVTCIQGYATPDWTLCINCAFDEGIGYLPYPNDVCRYLQCKDLGNGQYTKVDMVCPAGTSWDQPTWACVQDSQGQCQGVCAGHYGEKYAVYGLCRSYDECVLGYGLTRKCCGSNELFDRTSLSCVPDTSGTCTDVYPCGNCPYRTDLTCANKYWNTGILQSCPGNQHFIEDKCTCMPVDNCDCCPTPPPQTCDFSVPMDGKPNGIGGWVYAPKGAVTCKDHPDGCFFTTDPAPTQWAQKVYRYLTTYAFSNFMNGVIIPSVYIQVDIKPETTSKTTLSNPQGILTNENCQSINSNGIKIQYDSTTQEVYVSISGIVSGKVPVTVDEWNTISVFYDGSVLEVVVEPAGCPGYSRITHNSGEPLKNTYSALLIGAGYMGPNNCDFATFHGWMKNLCIEFGASNPFTEEDFVDNCETTTVENQVTAGAVDCSDCELDEYGVGYKPYPTTVCKFIQCVPDVNGDFVLYIQNCGTGTSWSQTLLTCVHDAAAGCQGFCYGKGGQKFEVAGADKCRTYDYCDAATGLTQQCCPTGTVFNESQQDCVTGASCGDTCGECQYTTDSGCANKYWVGNTQLQCGPDQHFDDDDDTCACVSVSNCNCCPPPVDPSCDLSVPMDGTYTSPNGAVYAPPASGPVTCSNLPDGCYFSGNAWLTYHGLKNSLDAVQLQSVYITFEFKASTSGVAPQGLLTNRNCVTNPTFDISYDHSTNVLRIEVNGVVMSTPGTVPNGQWVQVEVYYSGTVLEAEVTGPGYSYTNSVSHTQGSLTNTHTPLLIGAGFTSPACSEHSYFTGRMKLLCMKFGEPNPMRVITPTN